MHVTFSRNCDIPTPSLGYRSTECVIYWLGAASFRLGRRVPLIHGPRSAVPERCGERSLDQPDSTSFGTLRLWRQQTVPSRERMKLRIADVKCA